MLSQFSPQRLKGHRNRKGWTCAGLAKELAKVGISYTERSVSHMEQGLFLPSLPVFFGLAGVLGITANDLLVTCEQMGEVNDRDEYRAGFNYVGETEGEHHDGNGSHPTH